MTDAQIHQAIAVIPNDYWNRHCWTCRHEGHSTLSPPYLSDAQPLFFVYRYYMLQVTANPQMERYLEEKLQWRILRDKENTASIRSALGEAPARMSIGAVEMKEATFTVCRSVKPNGHREVVGARPIRKACDRWIVEVGSR